MTQVIPMQFFVQHWWKSCCCDQFHTYSQWFAVNLIFQIFSSWKVLKMLKMSCFKQNQCIAGKPQVIPMQFFAQIWWKSCCCDQFHTYSQWFTAKLIFVNFSIAVKCSKCLKWAVLSKITVSQVCLKLFPCNFLLNSGKSHVLVSSYTHIHSCLQ